ncbi:hypothetical protein C8R45DRAFT_929633 [Mycena sanguinolenta]|nr:hypothetical protein C8R45DRAFT_929633 [Mycena sanguinolenta]
MNENGQYGRSGKTWEVLEYKYEGYLNVQKTNTQRVDTARSEQLAGESRGGRGERRGLHVRVRHHLVRPHRLLVGGGGWERMEGKGYDEGRRGSATEGDVTGPGACDERGAPGDAFGPSAPQAARIETKAARYSERAGLAGVCGSMLSCKCSANLFGALNKPSAENTLGNQTLCLFTASRSLLPPRPSTANTYGGVHPNGGDNPKLPDFFLAGFRRFSARARRRKKIYELRIGRAPLRERSAADGRPIDEAMIAKLGLLVSLSGAASGILGARAPRTLESVRASSSAMQTGFTVSPVDEKIVAKLGLVILLPAASGAVRHIQLTSSMRSTCRSLNSAQTDSAFAHCVCGALSQLISHHPTLAVDWDDVDERESGGEWSARELSAGLLFAGQKAAAARPPFIERRGAHTQSKSAPIPSSPKTYRTSRKNAAMLASQGTLARGTATVSGVIAAEAPLDRMVWYLRQNRAAVVLKRKEKREVTKRQETGKRKDEDVYGSECELDGEVSRPSSGFIALDKEIPYAKGEECSKHQDERTYFSRIMRSFLEHGKVARAAVSRRCSSRSRYVTHRTIARIVQAHHKLEEGLRDTVAALWLSRNDAKCRKRADAVMSYRLERNRARMMESSQKPAGDTPVYALAPSDGAGVDAVTVVGARRMEVMYSERECKGGGSSSGKSQLLSSTTLSHLGLYGSMAVYKGTTLGYLSLSWSIVVYECL